MSSRDKPARIPRRPSAPARPEVESEEDGDDAPYTPGVFRFFLAWMGIPFVVAVGYVLFIEARGL
ncbi:hypothetical protein L6R50_09395 [Myxococcota bacterium]|nr:hypothetical protein [Myxococcota bacterium]